MPFRTPACWGVVTGVDISAATAPIPSAVRVPIDYYPMAVDKVRYAGEPVALVAADDRYVAEDALEADRGRIPAAASR